MNRDNIYKLIDELAASENYHQNKHTHDCGSPACIAGHAAHLSGIEGLDWLSGSEIETAARHWMGIDNYTGEKMFDGMPLGYAAEVTKRDAIGMLVNFALTGDVKWVKTREII